MSQPKFRITDRASREALAAILRELRYQKRRALELTAMCNHGLARIDLAKSRAAGPAEAKNPEAPWLAERPRSVGRR